jgi:sec-independent protein translocase protein TatA
MSAQVNAQFAMLTGWEIVALLAVVLLIFGAKKLPELARGLGQGIREFRKSSTDRKLENDKTKTEFI